MKRNDIPLHMVKIDFTKPTFWLWYLPSIGVENNSWLARGVTLLNKIFIIERGQYEALGMLMITVMVLGLVVPLVTAMLFNPAKRWKIE